MRWLLMNDDPRPNNRLGLAGWVALAVLAGLLAWVFWYAVRGWNTLAGVGISTAGWFFLVMGDVVTVAVGGGLMALVFYSNRHNFDR